MVGELITLPLRVGVRATQMWLRVTGEAVGVAMNLATQVLDRAKHDTGDDWASAFEEAQDPSARPTEEAPRARTYIPDASIDALNEVPRAVSPAPTAPPPDEGPLPPLHDEPVHVSEEPELVEEFSEPGAEEGAGAEVHVDEPWEGYQRLNAREVIARLESASAAELAAIQLYESGHRGRHTILAAVERELRTGNGSGSPTSERNR